MTDDTRITSALAALADELPPLRVDLDRVVRQAHRRRGRRQVVLLATVVAGSLAATMITLTAGRKPPPVTNSAGWSVTPVPFVGRTTLLNAVAPVTRSDVWAVGSTSNDVGDVRQTVVLHWDGQRWRQAGPADPGTLADVTAIGSTDVWAVGTAKDHTLASHWDGQAWTVTPTPSPALARGMARSLTGVAAAGSDDVWAVGCQSGSGQGYQPNPSTPLALHWDGQRWTEVELPAIPDAPNGACLLSVAARGPDDIFAVGHSYGGTDSGGDLTLHWDGTRWSIIPRLTGGAAPYRPLKVITAGDQLLAVGVSYAHNYAHGTKAAVLRWDGRAWQPALLDALTMIAATADGHGGFVVAGEDSGSDGGQHPALFHGTGGDFRPRGNLPAELTVFIALATVPGTDIVWAVGRSRMDPREVSPPSTASNGLRQFPATPWVGFTSFGR